MAGQTSVQAGMIGSHYRLPDLVPGMSAELVRTVTEADIDATITVAQEALRA